MPGTSAIRDPAVLLSQQMGAGHALQRGGGGGGIINAVPIGAGTGGAAQWAPAGVHSLSGCRREYAASTVVIL